MRRIAEVFFGRTAKVMAAGTTALVAAALLAPAPASAAGKPWAVTAYSGTTPIAKAYGDFANNGGVFATAGINYVDMSNNGRAVYVQVDWSFWRDSAGTGDHWVPETSKQTPRTQRMRYVPAELSTRLRSDSNRVRGEIKVCEDISGAYDKCSPTAFVAFDY